MTKNSTEVAFITNERDIKEIAQKIGPVFHIDAKHRIPCKAGWQENATRTPEKGMDFSKGVAIKTGHIGDQNLVIIDTDTEFALEYLKNNLSGEELDTFTVKTRRGYHFYYWGDLGKRFRGTIGLVMDGLDVRAEGNFIISPPSIEKSIYRNRPIAKLPDFISGILEICRDKQHGMSPEDIENFSMDSASILWEFIRKIDPGLNRNDWLKVLAISKFYFEESYETTLYWSALSDKFPGPSVFKKTWDSINRADTTPASLIYFARESGWIRDILPVIPIDRLDEAKRLALLLFEEASWLLQRGNLLTDQEKDALLVAAEVLTFSLFSNARERIAIPLPTGFGKSTLIRAFIKLLSERGIDKKLLVCVSRHAEILESIEELKKIGVGGETVGVYMSSGYTSDWDVTPYEIKDKQVIYISHNRVFGASDYDDLEFLTGSGENERLVLWDESAQTTRGTWHSVDRLEEQTLGLIRRMDKWKTDRNEEEEEFYQWLLNLDAIFSEQTYGQIWIDKMSIPEGVSVTEQNLKMIIKNSGCYASFTKNGDTSELLISMEIRIPDKMQSIIFDASSEISKLIGYDKSIKHLRVDIDRDFSSCKMFCVNMKSSKSHLNDEDNIDIQIGVLKKWMSEHSIAGEELLVITQKKRTVGDKIIDIPKRLEDEIPGIKVITWGSERGVNEFRGIKYTANIGMKWRDRKDLQAEIIAQQRNLGAMVEYQEILDVQTSEFMSEVQQWITRTNMRISKDGRANETKILFIHSEASKIAEKLAGEVFPGLEHKLFDTGIYSPEQQREERVTKIVNYLLATDEDRIATSRLKRETELTILSKDQWDTIATKVEERLPFQWEREGRSWVRCEAYISEPAGLSMTL